MSRDFYFLDLRSTTGHDLVMLSLWGNFEIVPVLKIMCYFVLLSMYQLLYVYAAQFFLVCRTFIRMGSINVM